MYIKYSYTFKVLNGGNYKIIFELINKYNFKRENLLINHN